MQQKKLQKPRKKKNSQLQQAMDAVLREAAKNDDIFYCESAYLEDYIYGSNLSEDSLKKLSGKTSEIAIFNALTKSKIFKSNIESFAKTIVQDIMYTAHEALRSREEERRYAEKDRIAEEKYQAKRKAEEAKLAEKAKRQKAERLILKETLTTAQRKQLKKFYNVDINK